MDRELTTKRTPNTTVTTKITFSTPRKDLYILKELLRIEDKPAVLDWTSTKTMINIHIIICVVFNTDNKFIFYYKDFLKINTKYLSLN